MQVDHCTWDDDYKQITQRIRAQLLALGHVVEPAYTAVLMQGSGTFGVESVLTTVVGAQGQGPHRRQRGLWPADDRHLPPRRGGLHPL